MNWPLKENVWCVYFNMLSSPTKRISFYHKEMVACRPPCIDVPPDTVSMMQSYCDALVLRHPEPGAAQV